MKNTQKTLQSTEKRLKVHIENKTYDVKLFDNPTANDLLSLLPLTLKFRDYGGQEKLAPSPRPLTMQGVPKGADPDVNDFAFYEPASVLVMYYRDIGYYNGIVRLGKFETSIAEIRNLPDGFTVKIELAE
ncbi:MAG TPA: cyclophilin-like fold protein [Dehalococcoidales bacterium]|nr:cyclophilin-like fold protein [Dehalococcoidales bacterium]